MAIKFHPLACRTVTKDELFLKRQPVLQPKIILIYASKFLGVWYYKKVVEKNTANILNRCGK